MKNHRVRRVIRFTIYWLALVLMLQFMTDTSGILRVHAQGNMPQEQLELGGLKQPFVPPMEIPTTVEPASIPIIEAKLDLSQSTVEPGDIVALTVTLTNSGTAVSEPYYVHLRLDESLSFVGKVPLENSSIGTGQFTSSALSVNEVAHWKFSISVDGAVNSNQLIELYATNASNTNAVQANTVLNVKGYEEESSTNGMSSSGTDEGWIPQFLAPAPSLFSGSATFGYGLEVPPGRRGLQPALGVNYSSRSTDGKVGWRHSGEVGEGWSLSGIPAITRKDTAYCWSENYGYICVVNLFSLTLNGASYDLQPRMTNGENYGIYEAVGNPALYIERRNDEGSNGSSNNVTSEYWIVRTIDGTEYRFGFNADAEQILFRTNNSDPGTGGPYTGEEDYVSTFKWWLDQVEDVYGNGMVYTYLDGHDAGNSDLNASGGDGCGAYCREVAVYPEKIYYNNQTAGTLSNWKSRIDFSYVVNGHSPVVGGFPLFANMRRLNTVSMTHQTKLVGSYEFDYTVTWNPNSSVIASLDSIQQKDYLGNAVLSPVEFEYQSLLTGSRFECWPFPTCGTVNYHYPYLDVVKNGYGGVHKLSYDHIEHLGVRCYYIVELDSWDVFKQEYPNDAPTTENNYIYPAQTDACFDDWTASPSCDSPGSDSQLLVGFSKAVVKVNAGNDPNTILSHMEKRFHTGNNRWNGKESETRQYYTETGTDLLSQSFSIWSADNSECPQNGLFDFVCLHKQDNYVYYYPT
jgi:uncharacterized repeat protein (TIGR01451 family)